jgi:YgiT-type zinc finger domain-containing protein
MMNCPECKGKMVKEHTDVTLFREETPVLFEDVPAWVCKQCGEVWLSAQTAKTLDERLASEPEPRRYISAPVVAFAPGS